jgi:hypothetical protein
MFRLKVVYFVTLLTAVVIDLSKNILQNILAGAGTTLVLQITSSADHSLLWYCYHCRLGAFV